MIPTLRPLHIRELFGGAPPKLKSEKTLLEDEFEFQIRAHRLPLAHRQLRLIVKRQWRWDFCFPVQRVSVEIDGLIVLRDKASGELIVRGGHATPQGMRNGMEKDHAAILVGWLPLHFERNHITSGYAIATLQRVLAARGWGGPT